MSQNPFAPPESDVYPMASLPGAVGHDGQFRDGKKLVHTIGAQFPDRCVKCNQPIGPERLERVVYWHHPAVYAALLLNVIVYAVIAMIVRKKATVHVGLCERHLASRRVAIIVGWAGSAAGLGAMFGGIAVELPVLMGLGIVGFLVALFWGLIGARVVYATKIDALYLHLAGVSKEYLAELPPFGAG